jgi:hypothetical protein
MSERFCDFDIIQSGDNLYTSDIIHGVVSWIPGTLEKRYMLMYNGLEYIGSSERNGINTSYINEG